MSKIIGSLFFGAILIGTVVVSDVLGCCFNLTGSYVQSGYDEALGELCDVLFAEPAYTIIVPNFSRENDRINSGLGVRENGSGRFDSAWSDFNGLLWTSDGVTRNRLIPLEIIEWISVLNIFEEESTAIELDTHVSSGRIASISQGKVDQNDLPSKPRTVKGGSFAISFGREGPIFNSYNGVVKIDECTIANEKSIKGDDRICSDKKQSSGLHPIVRVLNPAFPIWLSAFFVGVWGFGHHSGRGFVAVLCSAILGMVATCFFLNIF